MHNLSSGLNWKRTAKRAMRRLLLSPAACTYTTLRQPGLFGAVSRFCLFIGHGRSGSSLVGALLNAHPAIVMSNELDVFAWLDHVRSREQLFNLIYHVARQQAHEGSMGGGGYAYSVEGQWQGRHQTIRVIGDRKAGATAMHLVRQPHLARKLRDLVSVPVCFVAVVRNPFDTLTTTLKYTTRFPNESPGAHLEREIGYYFDRASAISGVISDFGRESVKFVQHAVLVARPREVLEDLCAYLGLDADDDYLASCARVVHPHANITRTQIDWPPELVDRVQRGISEIPWLREFSFVQD